MPEVKLLYNENEPRRIRLRETLNQEGRTINLIINNLRWYKIIKNMFEDFIKPLIIHADRKLDLIPLIHSESKMYSSKYESHILNYPFYKQEVYDYFRMLDKKDRTKILEAFKTFDKNKLDALMFEIKQCAYIFRNTKHYREPTVFKPQIENLRAGRPLRRILSHGTNMGCDETYKGFLRAIVSETLYTVKVKTSDGKTKRLFVKTDAGMHSGDGIKKSNNNFMYFANDLQRLDRPGTNTLALDPETMKVYQFRTNEVGKVLGINEIYSLKDIRGNKMLTEVVQTIRTKLTEYLNKKYQKGNVPGIERMKKMKESLSKKKTNNIRRRL